MKMSWGQLGSTLTTEAKKRKVPISGQFELTARCNLKCKMCYVCKAAGDKDTLKQEKSAEEWISLAREARDAGMLYLLLTGGEVFLREDFQEIYEAVAMMGFNINIYTNGTLITPEIAKWLRKNPPSRVDVTLYGASPETYSKVCGDPNGYIRAMNGIKNLIDEGITVRVRTTIIRSNTNDAKKIAEFALKTGLHFGIADYISPRREGSRTSPKEERLSPNELSEFIKDINDYYIKRERDIFYSSSFDSNIEKLDSCTEVDEIKLKEKECETFHCEAGRCAFWITWYGQMTPCVLLSEPATSPFKIGFNSAWNELSKLYLNLPNCEECSQCSLKRYCLSCPATRKNETGYFNKPSSYLCEYANMIKEMFKTS